MVVAIPAHRIAYMPLPKAGCTSVKTALAQIDPRVLPDAELKVHALYPTRRFRPHRWEGYADHWRFCVVRDPLARILSVYSDRVVQKRDLWNSRRLRVRRPGFDDLPRDPDPDVFFCNLQRYRQVSSAIKHHAFPAWVFLGPRLDDYEAVYRTQDLGDLAQELSIRSEILVRMQRKNASGHRLVLDDLMPATRDALRDLLWDDYLYLSEFFENPFGRRVKALARSSGPA